MDTLRVLQISMAAFVALGTVLLGIGQQSTLWPVAAIVVSAASVYLTDTKGWVVVSNNVANIAAWVALGISMWHLSSFPNIDTLEAMSELLVYLQFILLFKHKTVRNYWLLTISSLLQVSVGAALSVDVLFGVTLVIYMFVGLVAMSVFYLYRESLRHAPDAERLAFAGESFFISASDATPPEPQTTRRWPLLAEEDALTAIAPRDAATGLGWSLFGRMGVAGVFTLLVAALLFLFVPRVDRSPWRLPGMPQQRVVGFASEVTLGELGQVVESPSRVMRIRFVDPATEKPYALDAPPLLRGATLSFYSEGKWHRPRNDDFESPLPLPSEAPSGAELVRQEIRLQPLDTDVLCCVYPPVDIPGSESASDVMYSARREQLRRPSRLANQHFEFQLLTYGLRDHTQWLNVPSRRRLLAAESQRLLQLPLVNGELQVPRLAELAQQLVASIPPENVLERAQALDRYLSQSGRFSYSLNPPRRQTGVDPIEDFVITNPLGHCEYFASALTLMLRSVGIPARMVVGFRAGEFNPSTHSYEVLQLHAHAWVEAYIPPTMTLDEAAAQPRNGRISAERNGSWLTLDPTPGLTGQDVIAENYFWDMFQGTLDFTQAAWSDYVLTMDANRQKSAIYRPLGEALAGVILRVTHSSLWQQSSTWLGSWFSGEAWRSWWGEGFSLAKLARVALFVVVVTSLVWALAALVRLLRRRWWSTNQNRWATQSGVLFYRRLETILGHQRLARLATQTQREFAVAAGGQLADSPATAAVASLPRRIAEAFYRVRFGARPLDKDEAAAVEDALSQLEAALGTAASHNHLRKP